MPSITPNNIAAITNAVNKIQNEMNSFVYEKASPSALWSIYHNMGKFPSVTVVDSGNNYIIGDVEYVSNMQINVHFSAPFGGKAYLN